MFGRVYSRQPDWIFFLVTIPFQIFAWFVKIFLVVGIKFVVLFFTGGFLLLGRIVQSLVRAISESRRRSLAERVTVKPLRAAKSAAKTPPLPTVPEIVTVQLAAQQQASLPDLSGQYYLMVSDVQSGPYTREQIKGILAGAFVKPDDFIWCDDQLGWQRVDQITDAGLLPGFGI